jgi:hypothetical protein
VREESRGKARGGEEVLHAFYRTVEGKRRQRGGGGGAPVRH